MNKRNIGIFVVLFLLVTCFQSNAQGTKSIRINEVLIINENNFQDDYGTHSAWFELYNNSFATVNVKSCFLTNDKNNPRKYPIPKADILTKIPPKQHLLFWADGKPNRGTFHVNFTLDPEKDNWIGLYDANGKTLIDEVIIPAGTLKADQSYAREEDGKDNWVVKGINETEYVTPSTNNRTLDKNTKIESFAKHDSNGIGMAITAMSIVFSALLSLALMFKLIATISVRLSEKKVMKAGITDKQEAKQKVAESGEIYAAIGMALHEFQENLHDEEETILTFHTPKRNYSPWSSKIYTLRSTPHK